MQKFEEKITCHDNHPSVKSPFWVTSRQIARQSASIWMGFFIAPLFNLLIIHDENDFPLSSNTKYSPNKMRQIKS